MTYFSTREIYLMGEVRKETSVSDEVMSAITEFWNADGCRYKAEAIRKLIDLGLQYSGPLEVAQSALNTNRLPLNVSERAHVAVDEIRKSLPLPNGDKTYEMAYRIVIVKGLIVAGYIT